MPPYNNYPQNPQMHIPSVQEMALERQIANLQSQLQTVQAREQPYQQYQQTMIQNPQTNSQNTGVFVNVVDDFEKIPPESVPMDRNGAFFVKQDGTEIQRRIWSTDGNIIKTSYLPVTEPKNEQADNSPTTTENPSTGLSDAFAGVFQRFDDISERLGVLEQSILGVQDAKEIGAVKNEPNGNTVKESDDTTAADICNERTEKRLFQG